MLEIYFWERLAKCKTMKSIPDIQAEDIQEIQINAIKDRKWVSWWVELRGTLTWTIGLHDGIGPRSSLSTIPRTAQLDSDPVACGRLQVHQSDGLTVTVHWVSW